MSEIKLDYEIVGLGKPVIVFECGLGGSYYDWYNVTDALKGLATIITYHRSGYGSSESNSLLRTTKQIAEELNAFLDEIGISEQLIIVGHSFGGLCVQHFARLFPERVKGVVLVDSTSADFEKLYSLDLPLLFSHITIDKLIEKWVALSKLSSVELHEMMKPVLSTEQLSLPEKLHKAIEEFNTNPSTYETMVNEMRGWEESSRQIKSCGNMPDVPLYAIARDREVSIKFYTDRGIPEEEAVAYEDAWRKLQIEHSSLTKKGKLIIADGSDHIIQLEKPSIIINCLLELIAAINNKVT